MEFDEAEGIRLNISRDCMLSNVGLAAEFVGTVFGPSREISSYRETKYRHDGRGVICLCTMICSEPISDTGSN